MKITFIVLTMITIGIHVSSITQANIIEEDNTNQSDITETSNTESKFTEAEPLIRKTQIESLFSKNVSHDKLKNHPLTKDKIFAQQINGDVKLIDAVVEQGVPKERVIEAFNWFDNHSKTINNQNYLTIIDFTVASITPREYIINLSTGVVEKLLVAHGKNSGANYATCFSNQEGSEKSSLGFYLTGSTYQGDHGLSLNLHGKSETNSNAYKRRIVIHSADYVSEEFVKQNGRLGRSWGCPAVNPKYGPKIIEKLKNGSLLYIYGVNKC